MSIKKYRLYLLMFTLVVVIVGALSLLYFSESNTKGNAGTLVMQELGSEEIPHEMYEKERQGVEIKTLADWEIAG